MLQGLLWHREALDLFLPIETKDFLAGKTAHGSHGPLSPALDGNDFPVIKKTKSHVAMIFPVSRGQSMCVCVRV